MHLNFYFNSTFDCMLLLLLLVTVVIKKKEKKKKKKETKKFVSFSLRYFNILLIVIALTSWHITTNFEENK